MDAKESSLIAADTVSSALPVARISQTTQNPKTNDSVFHWNLGVFLGWAILGSNHYASTFGYLLESSQKVRFFASFQSINVLRICNNEEVSGSEKRLFTPISPPRGESEAKDRPKHGT